MSAVPASPPAQGGAGWGSAGRLAQVRLTLFPSPWEMGHWGAEAESAGKAGWTVPNILKLGVQISTFRCIALDVPKVTYVIFLISIFLCELLLVEIKTPAEYWLLFKHPK